MTVTPSSRPSADDVARALRAAFIGEAGDLREEDRQKVRELVPLLDEIRRAWPAKGEHVLVDACAGKSSLGVIAAALLPRVSVVAIERDPVRSRLLTEGARALGVADRVQLVAADVDDARAWPAAPRVVVGLHACGGATDLVIERAIASDAMHVLSIPCCYGDASARSSPFMGAPVARRADQVRIDLRRTLTLESAGYQCEVLELFAPTVSPFNLLWRARRVKEPVRMARAHAELSAST